MSIQRVSRFLPMAAIASLMTIMLFGGCPVAQQPTTPTDEQEQLEPPAAPGADGDLDRPIPPPDLDGDDDQDDSDGGDIVDGGGGGGGGGGPSSVSVTVGEPAGDLAVRLGTLVNVEFAIFDFQGALVSVEFVLVRDDDADYQPDGSPLDHKPLSFQAGHNTYSFDTTQAEEWLTNKFGRFLLGIRYKTVDGQEEVAYAPGSLSIDSQEPTFQWISPSQDLLLNRSTRLDVSLSTTDNRELTVKVLLDPDQTPGNGGEWTLFTVDDQPTGNGQVLNKTNINLQAYPSGDYYYYVTVSDGVAPPVGGYAETQSTRRRLAITDRLIGEFDLNQLEDSSHGAILQGVEFNDLAGSSMAAVPDLDDDGNDELLIGARFGKPFEIQRDGIGFGQAYLIYGDGTQRLRGAQTLNSVGQVDLDGHPTGIEGVVFTGIRTPVGVADTVNPAFDPEDSKKWTAGLSDVTVIPDMDGDDRAELVFSFPRVESISVANRYPAVQSEDSFPLGTPGLFEYDAWFFVGPPPPLFSWFPNEAQFTRGGIVIVSSQNALLQNRFQLNGQGQRFLDLQIVGQDFFEPEANLLPIYDEYEPYIREIVEDPNAPIIEADCNEDPEGEPDIQEFSNYLVRWDIVMDGQGPGGFWNEYSNPRYGLALMKPPLANIPVTVGISLGDFNDSLPPPADDLEICDLGCNFTNAWYEWNGGNGLPCLEILRPVSGSYSWYPSEPTGMGDPLPWTGFYVAGESVAVAPDPVTGIGCRILGQRVDDRFGVAIGTTGLHLFISAPERSARAPVDEFDQDNVSTLPDVGGIRPGSGVVYQMITRLFPSSAPYTATQLWIEPGLRPDPDDPNSVGLLIAYPYHDAQDPELLDYTMPTPHQYVIDERGYLRGNDALGDERDDEDDPLDRIRVWGVEDHECLDSGDLEALQVTGGGDADSCQESPTYSWGPDDAAYYADDVQQIVGPHEQARVSFVRGVGDVNGDDVPDFAIGSPDILADHTDPASDVVGGIFVIPGRPPGGEGDILLERLLLDPGAPERIDGLALLGADQSQLGRVFDAVGEFDLSTGQVHADFNADQATDIIVGSQGSNEAILIFGSSTVIRRASPEHGWTIDEIVAEGRAIRFVGDIGDELGASVAGAGDVDGDGKGDILIGAPGAEGGKGAVYLVYGSSDLSGDVSLADIGTFALPGVKFIGRRTGDSLGGGIKSVAGTHPTDPSVVVEAFSRGVTRVGDLNGDGLADYAIGAMLADPGDDGSGGVIDAGEIYILYGVGD